MAERIAFYSYKGGVGRSMILANVAVLLAQRDKRVVCIDFDLEASGLHTIFQVQPNRIELISVLRGSPVNSALIDLKDRLPEKLKVGKLWLLPAVSENLALQNLAEDVENEQCDLRARITTVIEEIERSSINPHYILIDCRTGMADTFYYSLEQAKNLVCVMRPNKQNVNGVKQLLDVFDRRKKHQLLVLSQVPEIADIETKIDALEKELGGIPARKFDVKIPLLPELALGETVAAISMRDSRALSSYKMVADWIDGV